MTTEPNSRNNLPENENSYGMAVTTYEAGNFKRALDLAEERLLHGGDLPRQKIHLHLLAALSLINLGLHSEGVARFELALRLFPLASDLLYNFAVVLSEAGNYDRARTVYQACLRVAPNHADALWNASELFRVNYNFGIAYCYLKRFEALGLKRFALWHRLAVCCAHLGLDNEAKAYFERAHIDDPNPVTTWENALYELSRKNYQAGWALYKDRFLASSSNNVHCESFGLPEWDGTLDQLRNKTLIILPEQGLGDQVQFVAALESLVQKAESVNAHIVLVARDELFALFQHSFRHLGVEVYPFHEGISHHSIVAQHPGALQMAVGDIPLYAEYITPIPRVYLKVPEAAKTEADGWLSKLPQRSSKKPRYRIGIAWGTSQENPSAGRSRRNVPVEAFAMLAEIPEFESGELQFVSLMIGPLAQKIGGVPELDAIDLSVHLSDYADTAGVMACCDLVLTPCTSIAHVAAALGRRVVLLLQHHGDWRWGTNENQSDWYPCVEIVRQPRVGDWLTPMQRAHEIIELAVSDETNE